MGGVLARVGGIPMWMDCLPGWVECPREWNAHASGILVRVDGTMPSETPVGVGGMPTGVYCMQAWVECPCRNGVPVRVGGVP